MSETQIGKLPEGSAPLIQSMDALCNKVGDGRCQHDNAGLRNERISSIHDYLIIFCTLGATAALLGSMYGLPVHLKWAGVVAGLIAALCTILQMAFKYPEKASRHSELSLCLAVLSNSCSTATNELRSNQMSVEEYHTRLRIYTEALNSIVSRATNLRVLDKDLRKCGRTALEPTG